MQTHQEDGNESKAGQKSTKLSLVHDSKPGDHDASCPAPNGLAFRLVADFVVEVNSVKAFLEETDLTAQQRSLTVVREKLERKSITTSTCRLSVLILLGDFPWF
jgi:hypothetical protein